MVLAQHDNDGFDTDKAIRDLTATLRRIKGQIEALRLRLGNLLAAEQLVKSITRQDSGDSTAGDAGSHSRFSPRLETLGPYRPRS